MSKRPGQRFTVAQFEAAIPGSGAIMATIARRVGCTWETANNRIKASPKLSQMLEDEANTIDDLAESALIKSIQEGNTGDARWWLERRRRGKYATQQQIDVTSKGEQIGRITTIEVVHHVKDDAPASRD